jgi:PKD repeat protein
MSCQLDVEGDSVTLTMTSYAANGTESLHSAPFTYSFAPSHPEANFSCTPTSGIAPLHVSCSAINSISEINSYAWNFGDGYQGTGIQQEHIYQHSGNYEATLTVTNNAGETATKSISIVASPPATTNHPPTAVVTADTVNGDGPLLVHFNGSGSSDPDNDALVYTWIFGDGSQGQGLTVTHTYTQPGLYNATLTVTDTHNSSSTATTPIIVNKPPEDTGQPISIITIVTPQKLIEDKPVLFTGENSVPSSRQERITRYEWNFGDGKKRVGKRVTHRYKKPGNYTLTLTVYDSSRKKAQTQLTIHIASRNNASNFATLEQVYRLLLIKPTSAQHLDNRSTNE